MQFRTLIEEHTQELNNLRWC